MPLPHTFTAGLLATVMKCSARPMHTLRLPWPAPSPRTAWPSIYAFWLMSSLVLRVSAAALQEMSEARMSMATFMAGRLDKLAGQLGDTRQPRAKTDC